MLCPCRRLLPRSPPPPALELKLNLWGAGGAWLQAAKPFREGRGRRSWRHSASNGRKWPVAMAGAPAPRACLSPALTPVLFSSPLLVLVILGTVLSSAAVSLRVFGSLWELSLLCSVWCFYSRATQIGSDAPRCQYGSGLCWRLLSAFSWHIRTISLGRAHR